MSTARSQFIVGRKEEVRLLGNILSGTLPYSVINVYGPGGIGKTVVCQKLAAYCAREGLPYAVLNEGDPARSTIDRMLSRFRKGIAESSGSTLPVDAFGDFDKKLSDYLVVRQVLDRGGGFAKMFDLAGNLLDHALLKQLLSTVKGAYEGLRGYFMSRDALGRYLEGAENWLTSSFVKSVSGFVEERRTKVVLLVDAYETLEVWDEWMCNTFAGTLPSDAKVVLLGRDRLNRNNPDWSQYGRVDLHYHELQELSEADAKAFLRHHGLSGDDSLDRVYAFTGGYPLCLVLAADLAREVGWPGVRDFADSASRDRVASQLLERILKQEKVKEIQEFLEKGVVARWFDPGAVSCILEVSPERGREIYDAIGKFSFVQHHPNGLQFHERVREMLEERLLFMDGGKKYQSLADRWSEYLAEKAGIAPTEQGL